MPVFSAKWYKKEKSGQLMPWQVWGWGTPGEAKVIDYPD